MFCEGAEKVSLQIICGSQITSLVETLELRGNQQQQCIGKDDESTLDIFHGGVT